MHQGSKLTLVHADSTRRQPAAIQFSIAAATQLWQDAPT